MNFNLDKPGLIILCQFKSLNFLDYKYHYWYIADDGVNYLHNNIGVLSNILQDDTDLMKFIIKKYKKEFEYTQEKVDLGFFEHWTALQITINDNTHHNQDSNFIRFFNNINITYSYNPECKTYSVTNYPNVKTQFDMFNLVIKHISLELESIFKPENVAQCDLTYQNFEIWDKHIDKLAFLEKARLKDSLIENLSSKDLKNFKKI